MKNVKHFNFGPIMSENYEPVDTSSQGAESAPARSILEMTITDESAKRILSSLKQPVTIDDEKLPSLVKGLQGLYARAYLEDTRSSHELRTVADHAIKTIYSDARSLRDRLHDDRLDQVRKMFDVGALGLYVSTLRNTDENSEKPTHVPFLETLDRSITALTELMTLTEYLQKSAEVFDKLSQAEKDIYLLVGPTERDRYIRQQLYPYFRKGSKSDGIGTDTYMVRDIASMYELFFMENFTVSATKSEYDLPNNERPDGKRHRQYHDGRPIQFACAVIRELQLHDFIYLSEFDVADGSAIAKTRDRTLDAVRDQTRIELMRTELAKPFPWVDNDDAAFQNPWEYVKNRIGSIWKNDSKRRKEQGSQG